MLPRPPRAKRASSIWRDDAKGAIACFAGRAIAVAGLKASSAALARDASSGSPLDASWLEQVHGRTVRRARTGCSGRGDALWTADRGRALVIVTADCVPVLIARGAQVAAVHAGWRGVAAGVVPAACARLAAGDDAVAWIGPSIGACCYEVGDDVARQVADVSCPRVVRAKGAGRPHLDLQAAVGFQLKQAGFDDVRLIDRCTHCHPDELWSYRRSGPRAGRNLALIWRSAERGDSEVEIAAPKASRSSVRRA